MKGLARYLSSVAFFCLIGLHVMLFNSIEAQGAILTADQLITQKVEELNRFVGVVEANSRNCGTCLPFILLRYLLNLENWYQCTFALLGVGLKIIWTLSLIYDFQALTCKYGCHRPCNWMLNVFGII